MILQSLSIDDVEHRRTPAPRSGQTRSGYGRRIPTSFEVKWRGRWRRVYCAIYSNAGTCYIQEPGGWIVFH